MYESFYGFREKPFQIVPSPKYLFKSEKHQNALTYLEYGLSENVGFILLSGEVGSGKTTLIQYILSQLGENTTAAVIFNTNVSGDELLRMILTQFEQTPGANKADNLDALNQFLIGVYGSGRQALLIIDEAQNLTLEAMEEVRMLSNLQSEEQTLLQIMLVGQPELNAKLRDPSLKQLAQRVAVRYHLTGLNREDTGRYIAYRLKRAGGNPDLFTQAAVDLIYSVSGGIPRSVNVACQAALVYGFADEAKSISQDIVKQILADNLGVGFQTGSQPAAECAPPDGGEASAGQADGLKERMEILENSLKESLSSLDNRLEDVVKGLAASRNGRLQHLKDRLLQERRSNAELFRKYNQLETKYFELKQYLEMAKRKFLELKARKGG